MNRLISFLISLFIAGQISAANYVGTIQISKNIVSIKIKSNSKKYKLEFFNSEIKTQIQKLNHLDYISLEGRINPQDSVIEVNYINFVGLQNLLGRWQGNDGFCYSFDTFSGLKIYKKNDKDRCQYSPGFISRDMSYTINPAIDNWSLLVSDTKESFLIDLNLKSKLNAQLSLYDPNSGDIIKEIKLKR